MPGQPPQVLVVEDEPELAEIYAFQLSDEYDVLTATPELTRRRRLWLLAKTWWHWRRNGDPEATFYAVSAVSERGPGATPTERTSHGQPTWRG